MHGVKLVEDCDRNTLINQSDALQSAFYVELNTLD